MQRALLTEGRIMHAKVDPGRPEAFPGGCRRIVMSIVVSFQIGAPIAPFACSGTSRVGNQGSEFCRVGENAVLGVGEVVQGSPSTPEPMDLYNDQMEAQRRDFTKARVSTSRHGGAELEHECIFTDGDEPYHAVAILVRLAPEFDMGSYSQKEHRHMLLVDNHRGTNGGPQIMYFPN